MTEEVTLTEDPAGKNWHLDKRVPVAIICAGIVQTFMFGWWAATLQANMDAVKGQVLQLGTYQERLIRVETKLESANETLTRIDRKMEDNDVRKGR